MLIQNKDEKIDWYILIDGYINVTKRKYIHTKNQRSDILIIEYKFI